MFRKMRRFNQELSQAKCEEILENGIRGVLAVNGEDGYPYTVPMDYIYMDGKVYFHSAKAGHKVDAIRKDSKVSFCMKDEGIKKDGDWAFYFNSVIVFGNVRILEDREEACEIARKLGLKYYPNSESVEELMKSGFDRIDVWELTIEHISGKLVHEA